MTNKGIIKKHEIDYSQVIIGDSNTICYRPTGNVNLDNPPQGGTGVPPKPKDKK